MYVFPGMYKGVYTNVCRRVVWYVSIVIVCTDHGGKELHRQVSVDRIIASGRLDRVMVSIQSP